MSTLWYHDHRVDFTSQNTYKGLVGFHCLFSEVGSNTGDTGDETTGFRLPSFPSFDIPLAFADKIFDPDTASWCSTCSTWMASWVISSWSTA